jgi:hypothetical protein
MISATHHGITARKEVVVPKGKMPRMRKSREEICMIAVMGSVLLILKRAKRTSTLCKI